MGQQEPGVKDILDSLRDVLLRPASRERHARAQDALEPSAADPLLETPALPEPGAIDIVLSEFGPEFTERFETRWEEPTDYDVRSLGEPLA
jgi:hypothetical protein